LPGIRIDNAAWKLGAQGGQSGIIGNIARGEHQGGGLVVQVGQLCLQCLMKRPISSNVPGSSSTRSKVVKGISGRKKGSTEGINERI